MYIATVSQVIDLNGSVLDWLACNMGHKISVHQDYYDFHESTLKLSRLLVVVDENNTAKYIGKILEDITIDRESL